MYNRYLRSDMGEYTRVPGDAEPSGTAAPDAPEDDAPERSALERLLARLRLDTLLSRFDSSDMLLLLLLLFLWREDADEEVLVALALLLLL